jgi:cell wall-associated NlpC family hydrolase
MDSQRDGEAMNTVGRAASKSHRKDTQIAENNTKGPRASRPHAAETAAVQIQNLRDLRAAVVREAESWIGTPFHHAARVKGAGIDCLMLLAEV